MLPDQVERLIRAGCDAASWQTTLVLFCDAAFYR
jgi:hypothetical protein